MDKKSKILFIVLGVLIAGSVAITYYKSIIKKNYVIEAQVDCDPYEKACFVWQCDPASTVEGEACTNDPEKDIWYYAIAKRNAGKIPACDPITDESCDQWTCAEGENDCSETFCDDKTKAEQKVECSDPVQYAIDNPVEEESACAEGDEACTATSEDETTCDPETTDCSNTSDANTDVAPDEANE